MASRPSITLLKRFAFLGATAFLFLFVCYPFYQISREWYCLKYYGDIYTPVWAFGLEEYEPMSVRLLPSQVLLFLDDKGRLGYIYFKSKAYGRAIYSFVFYTDGHKAEQEGYLNRWKYFPWQRISDGAIIPVSENDAYFFWNEQGFLIFNGIIDKVALSTLAEVESGSFSTNNIKWIQTGKPYY